MRYDFYLEEEKKSSAVRSKEGTANTLVSLAQPSVNYEKKLERRAPEQHAQANNSVIHTPVIWYLGTDLPHCMASHHGRFAILQGHVASAEVIGAARRRKR